MKAKISGETDDMGQDIKALASDVNDNILFPGRFKLSYLRILVEC